MISYCFFLKISEIPKFSSSVHFYNHLYSKMEKKLSLYKFTLFKTSESQPDIENQFSSPKNSMSKIKQFSKSNRCNISFYMSSLIYLFFLVSLKVNEKKTYESSENISKIESPFRVSNEFLARFSILEKLGKVNL